MTLGWKLVRCAACGQGLGKVKGEYNLICPKCKTVNKGVTETGQRSGAFRPDYTK